MNWLHKKMSGTGILGSDVTIDAALSGAELDAAYNARATVSEAVFEAEIAAYFQQTTEAKSACNAECDIPYAEGERFDLYPISGAPSPVVIFIHGGYWRALSKDHSGFMAPTLARQGIATIAPDYTLAPKASLVDITRQMRKLLAHVWTNHVRLNIDPSRIYLCGSSAGGHLVGTLLAGGWQQDMGLPPNVVAGALPISGLFDLAPIARTFPQEWLNLSQQDVQNLSPLRNLPAQGCPIVVAYAENEAAGFGRQSKAYDQAWRAAGFNSQELVIADRNHFDVVLDLRDETTELSKALLTLVG